MDVLVLSYHVRPLLHKPHIARSTGPGVSGLHWTTHRPALCVELGDSNARPLAQRSALYRLEKEPKGVKKLSRCKYPCRIGRVAVARGLHRMGPSDHNTVCVRHRPPFHAMALATGTGTPTPPHALSYTLQPEHCRCPPWPCQPSPPSTLFPMAVPPQADRGLGGYLPGAWWLLAITQNEEESLPQADLG
jgi:hypothetical protein